MIEEPCRRRGARRDSTDVEAVIHHSDVVRFVVEAVAASVHEAEIMSEFMHAKTRPPLRGDRPNVWDRSAVHEGLGGDDGVVTNNFSRAKIPWCGRLRGDGAARRILWVCGTRPWPPAGWNRGIMCENHVVVGGLDEV